jgi:predicted metalloprotease with PDZ domain
LSAGDTWVAIDGLRAATATLAKHLPRFAAGDTVDIDYFRHDQLRHTVLHIAQAKFDTVWLSVASEAAPSPTAALRQRWLGTALR